MCNPHTPARRIERGASTAEYSVGSIGAVMMAFWLYRLAGRLGDPDPSWYDTFVHHLIEKGFSLHTMFSGDWAWRWLM